MYLQRWHASGETALPLAIGMAEVLRRCVRAARRGVARGHRMAHVYSPPAWGSSIALVDAPALGVQCTNRRAVPRFPRSLPMVIEALPVDERVACKLLPHGRWRTWRAYGRSDPSIGVRDLDHAVKRSALVREFLVRTVWAVTSSGTIGGVPARRYHALLVAGLPPPFGRRVLLVDFVAEVTLPSGGRVSLCDEDGGFFAASVSRTVAGWRYEHDVRSSKADRDAARAETVHVIYRLLRGGRGGAQFRGRRAQPLARRARGHPAAWGIRVGATQCGSRSRCSTCRICASRCCGREARLRSAAATCPRSRTDGESAAATPCGTRFAIGRAFAVVTLTSASR